MILEILLVIIIVWFVYLIIAGSNADKVKNMRRMVSECVTAAGFVLFEYELVLHTEQTRTIFEKGKVPVVQLCTSINGKEFSYNTINHALLHEIAHILSPDVGHSRSFDSIELQLLQSGRNLGYITDTDYHELDQYYPCQA